MNDDPGWSPLSRTVGWFVEGVMHGGGGGIGYGGHCSSPWYSSCGGEGVMCGGGGGIGYDGHCSSPWYSSCGGEGVMCGGGGGIGYGGHRHCGGEGVMCDGGTTGHCCPPSILNSPLGQAV